jgi:hypothetical protein
MKSFPIMLVPKLRETSLREQKGSALLSVVIFAIILTIAGLAFFSLSSYDAGLYQRRQEASQALANAESGAERARWVLLQVWSKSSAQLDSAGLQTVVEEIDDNGQPTRTGEDIIDFVHQVRVKSRSTVNQVERELWVILEPGLQYALGAAHNVHFYGGANDGSWADFFELKNDVYTTGGIRYGNQITGNGEGKYDEANQGDVPMPDYFGDVTSFTNQFQGLADTVYSGDQHFGYWSWTWHGVGNDDIIFVDGDVEIDRNVENYSGQSIDKTIIATGDITVNSGMSNSDDRLVLISYGDVTMKGMGISDEIWAVILAGGTFETKGYWSWAGGGGYIHGFVLANDVDMMGYDMIEQIHIKEGWWIEQDLGVIMMNGGISVLQGQVGVLPLSLNQKSWAEVPPGS